MTETTDTTDVERDSCHFCGGGEGVLEQHHIVPRRHGGTDKDENLVGLCPTCHERLERLYNSRFYDRLGVRNETTEEVPEMALQTLEILKDSWTPNESALSYQRRAFGEIIDHFDLKSRFCTACDTRTFILPPEEEYSHFDGRCARCSTHMDGVTPHAESREKAPGWFDE